MLSVYVLLFLCAAENLTFPEWVIPKRSIKLSLRFKCLLPPTQAVPFLFWSVYSVHKVPYVPQQKGQGFKDVPSRLVTTECQLSGPTTPVTETGGMENVSESHEANWEEMFGWFWGTKKLRWKGWKKKKSFYPSQPRKQRRQNRYFISLLNSLPLCMQACVEKAAQLSPNLNQTLPVHENSN